MANTEPLIREERERKRGTARERKGEGGRETEREIQRERASERNKAEKIVKAGKKRINNKCNARMRRKRTKKKR